MKSQERSSADEGGLRAAWRAVHAQRPGRPLPVAFPHAARLAAARYTTLEDLDGADLDELTAQVGLNAVEARAVLASLPPRETSIMGYWMASGRYADTVDVTLLASGSRSAQVMGAPIESDRGTARVTVDVTEAAGDGALLTVTIESRRDATDPWRVAGTFAAINSVGIRRQVVAGLDRQVRAVGTPTPGATITFSVVGELV